MDTFTIHDIDDQLMARLSRAASRNGRTMEEEVEAILKAALLPAPVADENSEGSLYDGNRECVEPAGGIELELPDRSAWPILSRLDER